MLWPHKVVSFSWPQLQVSVGNIHPSATFISNDSFNLDELIEKLNFFCFRMACGRYPRKQS